MNNINEIFWNATVEEIKQGYVYDIKKEKYICLICGKSFTEGIIYKNNDTLCEARMAIKMHISKEHGPVFNYLINMNKKYTGLTEIQKELLDYFYKGLSDKEIVKARGGGSTSTIRNHRFKLKEREKQAKIFLALMGLLNENNKSETNDKFIDIHKGATMVDNRYEITEKEKEKIIKTYFEENGSLNVFPSKEKRKIVVLQHIVKNFKNDKKYTEKEVNRILKRIFEDYVTLRRYLIEYGFMERSRDCKYYWIKN
ncbi:DUF2087 domain-containing protein [Thermohalobacter berrensis]|uniref:Transcriptional regulator n=1 Tax=Thermohalobacter berrensis TaxID=99594 RepID=A0A419SXY2_9FIRM|nr:DUF2087 domain-containing protein [Thermohalobacter berrensis]RKD30056.1 transcriptional regulator [Thermohalobacter berrensis]